ncbi:MAG: hypothetical protein N3A38_07265 [Planctomycetota bacterium]|nr:hypothetical protein [Planctomycetota bacterium]
MSDWLYAWLPVFVGGIATLAIYSFLVKENAFYRFFEHLYIGIAAGFGVVFAVQRFLWPQFARPMLGYDRNFFASGMADRPWRSWYLIYLLPFAFGTLYYFIYSRKHQWLSRLVISWSLGVSGGFALKGFFAEYMPQIIMSFKPAVAVETVEREVLVRFGGIEKRLPPDAEITGGRVELYRLGPSRKRLVVRGKDGDVEEITGTPVRYDPAKGEIRIRKEGGAGVGEEVAIKPADVLAETDLPPAGGTGAPGGGEAYEGYGGSHIYKAYRVLKPWDPSTVGRHRRFAAGKEAEEAVKAALSAPGLDAAARVAAVEKALGRRLSASEIETVAGIAAGSGAEGKGSGALREGGAGGGDGKEDGREAGKGGPEAKPEAGDGGTKGGAPKKAATPEEALASLMKWSLGDFAPVPENNAGVELTVRRDGQVRDAHRELEWETAAREQVGIKSWELSPETLRLWFDRPEINFGVILRRTDGVGGSLLHRFASSAHPDADLRPRLTIEYRVPSAPAEKRALVLQQGREGYDEACEVVLVSSRPDREPSGPELLLGASALRHDGKLSVNWLSSGGTIANWIFLVTLICVMTYFLFSFEHSRPVVREASQAGRWLMMICFGAFFGSTIMARMALLVERLQFLIEKWLPSLWGAV